MFGFFKKKTTKPVPKTISRSKMIINLIDESPIYKTLYHAPVIASDLRIYSGSEYDDMLRNSRRSPFSREKFRQYPFPFSYPAFDQFVKEFFQHSEKRNIKNLSKLAHCPISNSLMKKPVIVSLEYKPTNQERITLIAVCDKSALQCLPHNFLVLNQREWDDLGKILAAFSPLLRPQVINPINQKISPNEWYRALRQLNNNFPPHPPKSLRARASGGTRLNQRQRSSESKMAYNRHTVFDSNTPIEIVQNRFSEIELAFHLQQIFRLKVIEETEKKLPPKPKPTAAEEQQATSAHSCNIFSYCYAPR